ncbi:MAG: hypothetical protein AAF253_13815 [Pseudomonadota bacterium]
MYDRYIEEGGKLFANALNGVAIAAFVGATVGQLFAPERTGQGGIFILFLVLGLAFHMTAQSVQWLVYRDR